MTGPPSDRTRLRRGAARAEYDRESMLAILDAGVVTHVGVTTPQGPIVLPMAYGRIDVSVHDELGRPSSRGGQPVMPSTTGDPRDEPEDLPGQHWAGHIPITSQWDAPVAAQDLADGRQPPATVADLEGRHLP